MIYQPDHNTSSLAYLSLICVHKLHVE